MISSLRGAVLDVGLDRVVIEVGGVGMLLHTTPETAADCRREHEARLSTSLVVREDSLTLYGFGTAGERDTFETVQTVSGVGPRLALAMLSVLGPDDLAAAVAQGDVATLTKVPGIGKKGAERLVLELRDKLVVPSGGRAAPSTNGHASTGWRDQVTEALVGLGWSTKQSGDAVQKVSDRMPPEAEVSVVLRAALVELGR